MAGTRRPALAQEEFDAAVRSNIEDFGMEADEAVSSAVEEFSLQGYCLDGIIKSVDGSNTANHPLAAAARALEVAAHDGAQPGDLVQRVAELRAPMRGLSGDELQQALVVASKEGVVAALLAAARAAAKLLSADSARSAEDAARALALQSLRGLRLLMQAPGCRAALLEARGLELLQQLLRTGVCSVAATPADEAAQLSPCAELAAAAAALAEAACWQDEEAKCSCMDLGLSADLLDLLRALAADGRLDAAAPAACAAAAGAAAGALRSFTTADDERPPASKAFAHARQLAGKQHAALDVLLAVLRQLPHPTGDRPPLGAVVAVMAAVRQVAANDEACKAFGEAGGVAVLQQLLVVATTQGIAELARGAGAALRQLANSDAVKAQLAEQGGLGVILAAARAYRTQPAVLEQLLGLLGALTLRMPDIAAAAADAGAIEVLLEVLAAAPAMQQQAAAAAKAGPPAPAAMAAVVPAADTDDPERVADEAASRVFGVASAGSGAGAGGVGPAAVQRQACMALRNMVVRNPELRPAFLGGGAEELLRGTRALFPSACRDVAAAALRDLGLDNYNMA